jgi:hypothetical protein
VSQSLSQPLLQYIIDIIRLFASCDVVTVVTAGVSRARRGVAVVTPPTARCHNRVLAPPRLGDLAVLHHLAKDWRTASRERLAARFIVSPLRSGNPAGRPRGARNRATIAAEALLEGEAEALTRKAIELAMAGDPTALRLCLERLVPPRKGRAVAFDLPALDDLRKRLGQRWRGGRGGGFDRGPAARVGRGTGAAADGSAKRVVRVARKPSRADARLRVAAR